MTSKTLFVFVYLEGGMDAVPAGELTLHEEGVRAIGSEFVYGTRYQARPSAIELDPVSLRFKTQKRAPGERLYPVNTLPLFGALRDAAPDAWGRRVIENKLKAPPGSLPESVYLIEAGANRVGALDVRSALDAPPQAATTADVKDLAYLLDAAARIEQGMPVPAQLESLFDAGSSFGGARPKASVSGRGHQWLAKFPAHGDGFNVPRVEYATLEMARAAGLQVPFTRIVKLAARREVLLIERFDRVKHASGWSRRHFVSALTLTARHESESIKGSYAELAQAIRSHGALGSIAAQCAELFGRMVFNILVCNDDDHLRNHAFLWSADGWHLAPLYDVVPHPQIASERFLHLSVGERGREATLTNAMTHHEQFGLSRAAAAKIVDRISRVVRGWKTAFEASGVSADDIARIESAFRKPRELGLEEAVRVRR